MAKLHQKNGSEKFGFDVNNTIGSTPQKNEWRDSWVDFYRELRLGYQLDLIEQDFRDTELVKSGRELMTKLDQFFEGIEVYPSLVHGDLWGGNFAYDQETNLPIIYDPAPYWGHHEVELSITYMFGGFCSQFYEGYFSVLPKQQGFEERN